MTVQELLKALATLAPTAEIYLSGGRNDDTDNWPCVDVITENEGIVVLMRDLENGES